MKITLLLILVMVVVFVACAMQPPETRNHIIGEYGFSRSTLLSKPWTPITSIFLHADLTHLLSNILVFFFFGIAVEKELKTAKYLLIFFFAAFAGDLAAMFFYPATTFSIGASAAVFGLVGAGMLVNPTDISFYPYVVPIPLAILGMFYILYNIYGFILEPAGAVSYIAHFGGLAIGLAAGVYERGLRRSAIIVILALIVLMIAAAVVLLLISQLGP